MRQPLNIEFRNIFLKLLRTFLIFISLFFLLPKCNNSDLKTKKSDRFELIPEPDKHQRLLGEAIQRLRTLNCDFFEPDTSLNGITLRNPKSVEKIIDLNLTPDEKGQYLFYSRSGSETLTLTQYPGDIKNSISLLSVSYSDKAFHGYKEIDVVSFETEKGIKLGLSKEKVIEKLGNCYAVVDSAKNYFQLYYRLEAPKDSKTGILATNNMTAYFAMCAFFNNKLGFYEFGFEYP